MKKWAPSKPTSNNRNTPMMLKEKSSVSVCSCSGWGWGLFPFCRGAQAASSGPASGDDRPFRHFPGGLGASSGLPGSVVRDCGWPGASVPQNLRRGRAAGQCAYVHVRGVVRPGLGQGAFPFLQLHRCGEGGNQLSFEVAWRLVLFSLMLILLWDSCRKGKTYFNVSRLDFSEM